MLMIIPKFSVFLVALFLFLSPFLCAITCPSFKASNAFTIIFLYIPICLNQCFITDPRLLEVVFQGRGMTRVKNVHYFLIWCDLGGCRPLYLASMSPGYDILTLFPKWNSRCGTITIVISGSAMAHMPPSWDPGLLKAPPKYPGSQHRGSKTAWVSAFQNVPCGPI